MNQVTVVEVLDPVNRYTISGIGYGLEGKVHHAVGASPSIDEAILPFIIASDAKLSRRQGRRRPHRGRPARARRQGGHGHRCEPRSSSRDWRRCRSTRPTS